MGGNVSEDTELSEAGKRELAEAVRILREDGVHIHKSYAAFQKGLQEQEPVKEEAGEGDPPPAKEKKEEPKVEYGLWGKKRTT
jgi:hypothetical protein